MMKTSATRPATGGELEAIGHDRLLDAYLIMRTIRQFEERLRVEIAVGDVPGFVHLYAGEEAVAAGVCIQLRPQDCVASTHRGHGHAIAKGCSVAGMMAEIFGRSTGLCRGKGGSMHIADLEQGMLGANGIVGAGAPLACGAGLAARVRGTDDVAVSFVGDGGSNQGAFLESLNLAAIWSLPVVFVVENNGYAESTSSRYHNAIENIADRAPGFGLPGTVVDGHDFFDVYGAASEALARARSGGGPSLIECKVTRYSGHFEGDAQTYRGANEVAEARATRDCLARFAERVLASQVVLAEELAQIDDSVTRLIDDAVAEARAAPWPEPSDLLRDVYVTY